MNYRKRKDNWWLLIGLFLIIISVAASITVSIQLKTIAKQQEDILNTQSEIMLTLERKDFSAVPNNESLVVEYADRLGIEISSYVVDTSERYGVDPKLVFAIIEVESNFDPNVISLGNYGLMQINSSNLSALHAALGTTNLLDAKQNIEAGIYWLSGIQANNHGSIEKDLMVYNTGSRGAIREWNKGVITSEYAELVKEKMNGQ